MHRGHRSAWQRAMCQWTVSLLLAALLAAVAAVAVAAEDGLPPGHVTPAFGTAAGGTFVTISGSGFTGATGVTFGGVAATGLAISGDGMAITATTPAHDVGAVPVVVTEANGTPIIVGGFFFTSTTPATMVTVTSVDPSTGSTAGHTLVVIDGSGFRDGAVVTFGGIPATETHVIADAIITAVTPAHDVGAVAVAVTNRSGQSSSLDNAFTYVTPPSAPAPTITRIEPATAPASGLSPTSTALDDHHGQAVTIIGTGFQPNAAVTFGGTPVDHATTLSGTVIVTTAPDHAAGKVDVVVTNPDNGSATLIQGFEYVAPAPGTPPTIASIDPTSGPTGDHSHTVVTITGTGFQPDATVTFGGIAAHDVLVLSNATVLALAPPHDAGAVDVVVTNPDGQHATSPQQFTYVAPALGAPPKIATVVSSPGSGGDHGSPLVTITGTGFVPGATVKFGDTAADHAEVVDSTKILTNAPQHAPGTVSVTVKNPDGQSDTLANAFTFVASATITSIVPNTGTSAGGDSVTITGTGFQPGAAVIFGHAPATNVVVNAAGTSITAMTPAHPVGVANLYVINPVGPGGGLAGAFTFTGGITPPPTTALSIHEVEPGIGPAAGGARVRIEGTGFTAGVTVTFDTMVGTNVEIIDSTHLVVTTPAHAVGLVNVKVTNVTGDVSTLNNAYGYIATTPDHRPSGGAVSVGGPPPAPIPIGGRKDSGTPNTPATAGVTSPDASPPHR